MRVIESLLTSCPSCPNWQIDCLGDEGLKERLETKHADVKHGGVITSEAVAELLYADPKNSRQRDVVEECVREDAQRHNGHVDTNRVRELIPSWVAPQLVGSVYNVLIRRGALVPQGQTRNPDAKGRNKGKPLTTYLYRGDTS